MRPEPHSRVSLSHLLSLSFTQILQSMAETEKSCVPHHHERRRRCRRCHRHRHSSMLLLWLQQQASLPSSEGRAAAEEKTRSKLEKMARVRARDASTIHSLSYAFMHARCCSSGSSSSCRAASECRSQV